MTDVILSSRSTHKYIQPHYVWAERIISHRISCQSFIDLLDLYRPGERRIFTTYYDTDIKYTDIFHVSKGTRTASCHIHYFQETVVLDNIEYIGENIVDLSITRFAPSLTYNHERQGVHLIKDNSRYTMILEILVPHIVRPEKLDIDTILGNIRDGDLSNIISLSYRFVIKSIGNKELTENIVALKNLTKQEVLLLAGQEEEEED
jgi:hypothetical protein